MLWTVVSAAAAKVAGLIAIGLSALSGTPGQPATGGASSAAPAGQVAAALPRVDIYGDSVTWESEYFLGLGLRNRANFHYHVFPGTSLCFWFDDMRKTAQLHPSMVVVTFAAWPGRACDKGATDRIDALSKDASTAASIFSHSLVVLASDPPEYAERQQAQINAALARVALAHKNAYFDDATKAVAPDGAFVWTLPCRPDETPAMGCVNGKIAVRAPDGVHLCPVISKTPTPGGCSVYSSGQARFSSALLEPAMKMFPSA